MTIYYVAPTGSDSNNGLSLGTAWLTLAHAAATIAGGDTVNVADGTYTLTASVQISATGSSGARTVFQSINQWGAKIVNTIAITGSGSDAALWVTANFVDIIGFDVSGAGGRIGIYAYGATSGSGSPAGAYIRVQQCYVHDLGTTIGLSNNASGINSGNYSPTYNALYNEVTRCIVRNVGQTGNAGSHGIYFGTAHGVIANNIVDGVPGFGIRSYHFGNHMTIANNLVFSCGSNAPAGGDGTIAGGGIYVSAGGTGWVLGTSEPNDFTTVTNNILRDCIGYGGLYESAEGQTGANIAKVVANNTFSNNSLYHCVGRVACPVWLDSGAAVGSPPATAAVAGSAIDTFVRANQSGFGTASGGEVWTLTADATPATLSILSNQGKVTGSTANNYIILGASTLSDGEALVRLSTSSVNSLNFQGVVLRFGGYQWYGCYLRGGNTIVLQKMVEGVFTGLASNTFTYSANQEVWLRFNVTGTALSGNAWLASGADPGGWLVTATDGAIPSGSFGLFNSPDAIGTTAVFDSFSVTGQRYSSDPLLVAYQADGTGDYHLADGSPLIDAGTATGAPTLDFDGRARPYGAGYDIGPYEGPEEAAVTSTTTGTNQTVEVRSQGATGATGRTTGIPAVPTGNGWVYDPGPGTIAAGDWSASITMSASSWSGSSSTTKITLRAFSSHNGAYTLIGAWAPTGITGTAKTTYSFPATAFGGVSLAEGDFVYLDLWWQNTGAGGIGGNNPVVYVSATATVGVAGDMQVGLPTFTPAPVVPPPTGLPLTLTVGGVPVTPVGTTLSAKSTVGRRGELAVTVFDPSGARHLQQYQQVALVDQDGTLAFTGYITSPVETKPGFSALLVTQFTATDQHYLADKRIVAKFYRNQTVEYMVNDLSTSILQGEGVSIGQITPTGVTVPIANFGYVTVADALDALVAAASSTGIPYYWMIDQNKALWVVPYATLTGPAVDGTLIDDGPLSGVVPTVTRANPKYRNTQYAVGGVKETGTNDETRAGDGQTRTFPFSYPLNAAPTTFTLNGTAKSLGVKGQTSYSYYYAVGDNTIVQDSGQTLLTSTDRLRMVYVGQVPAVFTAQNAAQVAAQAALDGTSGIIEAVLTDKTIGSQAQGTLEVGQELTRYCLAGTKFVFATRSGGFAPGQQITVTYAPFGFAAAQMLVTEVDLTDQQDGTMIWYIITAVQGPYDTTWVEFFGNLLKPQNYQLASNISLGVSLNSPLLPSTTTWPSLTLYPQD